jgi:hypothetical protein
VRVQGPGCRGGGCGSFGGGWAHPAADVEVVDGGEGVVDSAGGLRGDGEEVGAPGADCAVAGAGVGEGLPVDAGGVQPGEVLAGFGGVGAPGFGRQPRVFQRGTMGRVDGLQVGRQRDGVPSAPAGENAERVVGGPGRCVGRSAAAGVLGGHPRSLLPRMLVLGSFRRRVRASRT